MNVDITVIGVYIQKQLGCFPYLCNRFERVFAADYREERNCIKDEQVRACNPEEVSHHQVCCPCCLQVGKAVEYVECIESLFGDDVVNLKGK